MRVNITTPDYRLVDLRYNATSNRKFIWGLWKFSILFGTIGGYLFTDDEYFTNDINSRADLQHRRTMMPIDRIPVAEKKIHEMMKGSYFGDPWKEKNNSIWKRTLNYFYPYRDYNPDRAYIQPFYDYKKEYVPNEFKHHYHFDV